MIFRFGLFSQIRHHLQMQNLSFGLISSSTLMCKNGLGIGEAQAEAPEARVSLAV